MKKILKTIILTICIIISSTAPSYADDNTAHIYVNVIPSYIIDIPSTITIPYSNLDSLDCKINFSNVFIEEGYDLRVDIEHDNFILTKDPHYQITYETDFTETIITMDNTFISFKIYPDEITLSTSPPGKYTSKVTILIKYIKL